MPKSIKAIFQAELSILSPTFKENFHLLDNFGRHSQRLNQRF
jgi:hypothetical protein